MSASLCCSFSESLCELFTLQRCCSAQKARCIYQHTGRDETRALAVNGQTRNTPTNQSAPEVPACVRLYKICQVSTVNHPSNEQKQQIKPSREFYSMDYDAMMS